MRFKESAALLSSKPLHLETGIERLSSGGMHVAIRACLENCTAEMLEWWFGCECDTDMYRLWHPGAHKSSKWGEYEDNHVPGNVIGSTHFIQESLGNGEVVSLQLKFIDPAELFGDELVQAKERGDVDVVLYGWGGEEIDGKCMKNDKGYPAMVQYLGVGRNTPYGLVLRNHYWIGDTLDLPPEQVETMISEDYALGLLEHDSNEFHILGKVIPPFYLRDNWGQLGEPEPYTNRKRLNPKVAPKLFV